MNRHHNHGHAYVVSRHKEVGRLKWVLTITLVFMVAEIVGGFFSRSLALLADAGHMFTDVAALSLSLFAMRLAQRPPSKTKTFGYVRLEILAALINGATLLVIA
ncbi:MAG TPA: cation transporter, partial [Gemmatimonadetes bacterium]|nr:cation transporter [Gemmatimonadota bacterium]